MDIKEAKFVIAYDPKDVEILTKHGFRLAGSYQNSTLKRTEHVFINQPAQLLRFNLENMKLSFTNMLMFSGIERRKQN